MDFDETDQLLIRYSEFVRYCRKQRGYNGTAGQRHIMIKREISYIFYEFDMSNETTWTLFKQNLE